MSSPVICPWCGEHFLPAPAVMIGKGAAICGNCAGKGSVDGHVCGACQGVGTLPVFESSRRASA